MYKSLHPTDIYYSSSHILVRDFRRRRIQSYPKAVRVHRLCRIVRAARNNSFMTISFRRKSQFPIHPATAATTTAILALSFLPPFHALVSSLSLSLSLSIFCFAESVSSNHRRVDEAARHSIRFAFDLPQPFGNRGSQRARNERGNPNRDRCCALLGRIFELRLL